jgi:hypothetical protein
LLLRNDACVGRQARLLCVAVALQYILFSSRRVFEILWVGRKINSRVIVIQSLKITRLIPKPFHASSGTNRLGERMSTAMSSAMTSRCALASFPGLIHPPAPVLRRNRSKTRPLFSPKTYFVPSPPPLNVGRVSPLPAPFLPFPPRSITPGLCTPPGRPRCAAPAPAPPPSPPPPAAGEAS